MIYYVYQLVDPRTGKPFYVGKGKDRRAWFHAECVKRGRSTGNIQKDERIAEIHAAGLNVAVKIVERFDGQKAAYAHERKLIASIEGLTNAAPGGGGAAELHPIAIEYRQIERGMKGYKGKSPAIEHLRRLCVFWEKWERLGYEWVVPDGADGVRSSSDYDAGVKYVIQARDHLDGKDVPFPEYPFDLGEICDRMDKNVRAFQRKPFLGELGLKNG